MSEVVKESEIDFKRKGFGSTSKYKELGDSVMALKEGELLKCHLGYDFMPEVFTDKQTYPTGWTCTVGAEHKVMNQFRSAFYNYMRINHNVKITTAIDGDCMYLKVGSVVK
jgi:hypothetical protein